VVAIKAVLGGLITIANSTVTVTRSGDGATVSTLVIPFTGSAEGNVVNGAITANSALVGTTNNYLKIATDGASSTTTPLFITIKLKVTE
jgi:hypothetical protein